MSQVPTYTKPGDPAGNLTAREHAAITLRCPNSGTEWLDAMISQALIRDSGIKLLGDLFTHYGVNTGNEHPSEVHQDQVRAMTDAAFSAAQTAVWWEGEQPEGIQP